MATHRTHGNWHTVKTANTSCAKCSANIPIGDRAWQNVADEIFCTPEHRATSTVSLTRANMWKHVGITLALTDDERRRVTMGETLTITRRQVSTNAISIGVV